MPMTPRSKKTLETRYTQDYPIKSEFKTPSEESRESLLASLDTLSANIPNDVMHGYRSKVLMAIMGYLSRPELMESISEGMQANVFESVSNTFHSKLNLLFSGGIHLDAFRGKGAEGFRDAVLRGLDKIQQEKPRPEDREINDICKKIFAGMADIVKKMPAPVVSHEADADAYELKRDHRKKGKF